MYLPWGLIGVSSRLRMFPCNETHTHTHCYRPGKKMNHPCFSWLKNCLPNHENCSYTLKTHCNSLWLPHNTVHFHLSTSTQTSITQTYTAHTNAASKRPAVHSAASGIPEVCFHPNCSLLLLWYNLSRVFLFAVFFFFSSKLLSIENKF